MPDKSKPNCYECKHRRVIPGDTHSSCHYPGTESSLLDAFLPKEVRLATRLNITGHPHSIKNGWFTWPINFDPVWLLSCDGFTPVQAVNTAIPATVDAAASA